MSVDNNAIAEVEIAKEDFRVRGSCKEEKMIGQLRKIHAFIARAISSSSKEKARVVKGDPKEGSSSKEAGLTNKEILERFRAVKR